MDIDAKISELKKSVADLTDSYCLALAAGNLRHIAVAQACLNSEKDALNELMKKKFAKQRRAIAASWKSKREASV
jgi:hypothetical protein